jgi:hypothetical protein
MLLRRPSVAAGLAAIAVLAGCNPTPVTINPPRVQQGGRALSIAVASTDDKRMVVATETGGLFRTFDGGASWQHLNGLPNVKTIDVAIASLNPNIIIATTQSQYRAVNDGGIWRSIDDGSFLIDIPVAHAPGEMIVTVEQRDGNRLSSERTVIDIATQDRAE